jgi:hypothetical protein
VIDTKGYFKNEREWRIVLEWADESVEMTRDAARTARVGFYVPILDKKFNSS